MENEYVPARKTGRCFNGSELDGGILIHYVPKMPDNVNGDWFDKALCGTEPGRRGNGWSKDNREVTCKKCIKRLNKMTPATGYDSLEELELMQG